MKIYAMYIIGNGSSPKVIDFVLDFNDVGFSTRQSAIDICNKFAERFASAQASEALVSASEQNLMFHKLCSGDAVALVVATQDYPSRVAFAILREIMDEYKKHGGCLPNGQSSVIRYGMVKYQEPRNIEKMATLKKNIEEARELMTANLHVPLRPVESLEEMLGTVGEMSPQAQAFTRESNRLNRCCSRI